MKVSYGSWYGSVGTISKILVEQPKMKNENTSAKWRRNVTSTPLPMSPKNLSRLENMGRLHYNSIKKLKSGGRKRPKNIKTLGQLKIKEAAKLREEEEKKSNENEGNPRKPNANVGRKKWKPNENVRKMQRQPNENVRGKRPNSEKPNVSGKKSKRKNGRKWSTNIK